MINDFRSTIGLKQFRIVINKTNSFFRLFNVNQNTQVNIIMSSTLIAKKESLIHKIREIDLERIVIEDEYDVVKEIGSGDYGKVCLAIHKKTGTQVS